MSRYGADVLLLQHPSIVRHANAEFNDILIDSDKRMRERIHWRRASHETREPISRRLVVAVVLFHFTSREREPPTETEYADDFKNPLVCWLPWPFADAETLATRKKSFRVYPITTFGLRIHSSSLHSSSCVSLCFHRLLLPRRRATKKMNFKRLITLVRAR